MWEVTSSLAFQCCHNIVASGFDELHPFSSIFESESGLAMEIGLLAL
jgi:hypothetical protein